MHSGRGDVDLQDNEPAGVVGKTSLTCELRQGSHADAAQAVQLARQFSPVQASARLVQQTRDTACFAHVTRLTTHVACCIVRDSDPSYLAVS